MLKLLRRRFSNETAIWTKYQDKLRAKMQSHSKTENAIQYWQQHLSNQQQKIKVSESKTQIEAPQSLFHQTKTPLRPLSAFLHVDAVRSSSQSLESIWMALIQRQTNAVGSCIPQGSSALTRLDERIATFPQFIIPLPRENEAWPLVYFEWQQMQTMRVCHLTELQAWQKDPILTRPVVSLVFHTEATQWPQNQILMQSLMHDLQVNWSITDVQWFAHFIQAIYLNESNQVLWQKINECHKPNATSIQVNDYIKELAHLFELSLPKAFIKE